jgi:hypothetical protein
VSGVAGAYETGLQSQAGALRDPTRQFFTLIEPALIHALCVQWYGQQRVDR